MNENIIGDRYVYSQNDILHESNHIQVYEGLDNRTQQQVYIKIIDEKAFNIFEKYGNQEEKDILFKTGIEIKNNQTNLFNQLANTNGSRLYTPQVIDMIDVKTGIQDQYIKKNRGDNSYNSSQIAIILQGSRFGSMKEYLKRNNYLEEADALVVFKQIALGLQEMHQLNITHGAICLDNIIIQDQMFQLSQIALGAGEFSKITKEINDKENESNYYLAPELLSNINAGKTMKSDVWALGILFFRLLRGSYFYGGNNRDQIYQSITAHKTIMKTWLDEFDKKEADFPIQISKQCQFFLGKMLSKNPDDRPTIEEILNNSLLEVIKIIGNQNIMQQQQQSNLKKYGSDLLMQLPAAFQNSSNQAQYTFFRETRTRNDIDGYMVEDLYFGVMITPNYSNEPNMKQRYKKQLIRFKVVGNFPHQKIDRFLENVEKFKQIQLYDGIGRSEIVRIHEIVHLLPSQSSNFGQVIIAQDYCNQGNLNEYFIKRKNTNQKCVFEIDATLVMHRLLNTMTKICNQIDYHGSFHMKNLYLDQGMIKIGEPLIISSITEQKFQENREIFDYFAPEYKEDVGVYDPRTDLHKVDIWSFGMIFYKMVFGDIPIFDLNQKPIFTQSSNKNISERVRNIIRLCLIINVPQRAEWPDVMTLMHQEQIEQNYDLTIQPKEENNNQNNQDDDLLNEDIVPYENKSLGDKYKMKNMLSKIQPDSQIQNNSNLNQKKGRFFQKMNQDKLDENNSDLNENSRYLDGQNNSTKFQDNRNSQLQDKSILQQSYLNQTKLNNISQTMKTNIENEEDDQIESPDQYAEQNPNQSIVNQSILNDSKYGIIDYDNKFTQLEDIDHQTNNNNNNNDNISYPTQVNYQTNINTDNEHLTRNKQNSQYDKQNINTMNQIYPQNINQQSHSQLNQQQQLQQDDYSLPIKQQSQTQTQAKKFRENREVIDQIQNGTLKAQPNILLRYNEKTEEQTLKLIQSKVSGGERLRILKKVIKASVMIILFLAVFFRKNMVNSLDIIGNRGDMKIVDITVINRYQQRQTSHIITQNTQQFITSDVDLAAMQQNYGCLDNEMFQNQTNQKLIIDVLKSTSFFFYAFLSFISLLFIIALRVIHIWRVDLLTIYQNSQNGMLKPFNRYLMHCQFFTYLEFSFIYYSHYQLFNYFYYSIISPCLGVELIDDSIPLLTDGSRYIFSDKLGEYFVKICCTNALFGSIHVVGILFYMINPLKNSDIFMDYFHAGIRGCSYIFGCWIMCRIGGFLIFQPTFSYDDESFISASLGNGEYQAVFGFIPELIEIIFIALDIIIEFIFYQIGLAYDKNSNFSLFKRKRDLIQNNNLQFKRNPILLASQQNNSLQIINSQNKKQTISNAALSAYSKRSRKIIEN